MLTGGNHRTPSNSHRFPPKTRAYRKRRDPTQGPVALLCTLSLSLSLSLSLRREIEQGALALQDLPASEDHPPPPEAESLLAALVYDVSQQVQSALESMLKMTGKIHQKSCEITEEMERCKESVAERKKSLDEQKECVQKAAYTALQMLRAEEFS